MKRDTLGLADDSLFIKSIKDTVTTTASDLTMECHAFLLGKACEHYHLVCDIADLNFEKRNHPVTISSALRLSSTRWQNPSKFHDIKEHFGLKIATSFYNLISTIRPFAGDLKYCLGDIQSLTIHLPRFCRKMNRGSGLRGLKGPSVALRLYQINHQT